MNTVEKTIQITKKQGMNKAQENRINTFLKSLLAGMFIGIGGTVSIKVVTMFDTFHALGKIAGAFTFTIGFILIITLGAQLFTSNNLLVMNVLEKELKLSKLIENWILVWIGNFVGTFLIAALVYFGNSFQSIDIEYVAYVIDKKIHLDFVSAIFLGIGCNIIIVLTVLLVNATQEYIAKIFVSIFGVMIFLLSGYEHIIANMFYFGLGFLEIDSLQVIEVIVHNVIPVTIGNVIGGGIVIPILFHLTYKTKKELKA